MRRKTIQGLEIDAAAIEKWRAAQEEAARQTREKIAERRMQEHAEKQAEEPNPLAASVSDTQWLIAEVCDEFKSFLIGKNVQYGDSAIHPVRIFSSASDEEQLLVRIDDKLSRLFRGTSDLEPDDDIMDDLVGYWIMLKVLRKAQRADA